MLDVFQEACVSGDLDAAEELLAVLEGMQRRRQDTADRRLSNADVARARAELATRKAARARTAAAR